MLAESNKVSLYHVLLHRSYIYVETELKIILLPNIVDEYELEVNMMRPTSIIRGKLAYLKLIKSIANLIEINFLKIFSNRSVIQVSRILDGHVYLFKHK